MPKKSKDHIGTIIQTNKATWKIVQELDRGLSRDRNNGIEDKKPIIRMFLLECQKCHNTREARYSSIFTKNNVICHHCAPRKIEKVDTTIPPKLKLDGTVDTRYTRGPKVEFVGKTFECAFDTFLVLEELPRVLSKSGRNVYRNFRVKCLKCETERETLAASLNAKGVACPQCRTQTRGVKLDLSLGPIGIERKIEILHEINGIWDEMKRLQRMGQLTKFLVDKFDVNDWLLTDDKETEHIQTNEVVGDSDDIDYDNPDIDWNNEIDKYL